MTEIGQRMCDCFLQQWNCNLWDDWQRERGRNMLRSYKFKQEFYISWTLSVPTKRSHCKESVLPLNKPSPMQIDKGSYHRPCKTDSSRTVMPNLKMGKEVPLLDCDSFAKWRCFWICSSQPPLFLLAWGRATVCTNGKLYDPMLLVCCYINFVHTFKTS